MQLLEGRLIHTATDLASFLGCAYRGVLAREAALGHLPRPTRDDPVLKRLARRGRAFEADWVARLRIGGREVVEVPRAARDAGLAGLEEEAARTLQLMRDGTDVIVQGVLFDGTWLGYADALERVPGRSALGDFAYEVSDTKLRGYVHAGAVVQLAQYTAQLTAILGTEPAAMHLDLGDGRRVTIPVAHAGAFHRRVRDRYLAVIADAPGLPLGDDGRVVRSSDGSAPMVPVGEGRGHDGLPYPWAVSACQTCPWAEACLARREADDHLTVVPGMRRDHARRLASVGVTSRRTLARLAPKAVEGVAGQAAVPEPVLARHREAAALSLELHDEGHDRALFISTPPSDLNRGIWRLPESAAHDTFLHVEQDPYRGGRRFTFAGATVAVGEDGATATQVTVAVTDTEERDLVRATVRALLPILAAGRRRAPGDRKPHVYVWGEWVINALQGAAVRHGTGERDLQNLLETHAIVDLRTIIRECVRTPRPIESLADLDRYAGIVGLTREPPFLAFDRMLEDDVADRAGVEVAMGAMVERLARVRDWILAERRRRDGHEAPVPVSAAPSDATEDEIRTAIMSMLDAERARRRAGGQSGERAARAARLLADLLRWHRREDGAAWTEYYSAMEADPADLIEHPSAIGGLRLVATVRPEMRRFSFPRGQEYRLSVGDVVSSREWGARPRLVVENVDGSSGIIDLRIDRGHSWDGQPVMTAVVPNVPVASMPLRKALVRVAQSIDELGADPFDTPGRYGAARCLLLGQTPVPPGGVRGSPMVRPGEDASDAVRRLALTLDGTALPVQGPPGSGKTHAGARAIVGMIAAGKRVGICAHSHRAIANLLDATLDMANELGVRVDAVQRANADQRCRSEGVILAASTRKAVDALKGGQCQLVAGTAWLFSSPDLELALDALFIDEAGQMCMANAVAASTAARQVILLGDPRQLAQPVRADHPDGVGTSALAHLIGDHETVPADRGIFLPVSWRMHPEICAFVSEQVYEGRLTSHDSCARQSIGARTSGSARIGSGLRRLEVAHTGNRVDSREEVVEIVQACNRLIGVPWTDQNGDTRRLEPRDVIVVAPYNRQVDLLNQMLPRGVVAGTVDRFQGQEAPVVFYSMTASDTADASRGIAFLFGLDRLNVAISRARALAVLVFNPALLSASCHTAEEVRLVNAACRLAELAVPLA